ncbi:hypothetical protein [Cyclobacterium salsum]|uniref:hypothetical protein n=1 Tax=Cyclobacterium salsum TaxID=2666329 RepID=UPI0013913E7D|nr:hypothetical protein [Cyclobacterium salsum]
MCNEKLKTFLKKGAEITGGIVGGAVGLIGGPIGSIAGGGLGVLSAQLIQEIIKRSLSNRQQIRIAATSTFIFDGIKTRLDNGETIRNDNFFERSIYDRSNAEELFEGTLLRCANQFQEKKIIHISKIFEETVFTDTISPETANQLLELANSLTYRKLSLISFYGRRRSDLSNVTIMKDPYTWYPHISLTTNEKMLNQDLYELINSDLLYNNNTAMFSNNDILPDKITLTKTGQDLFEIMDLKEIDKNYILNIVRDLKYKTEWGRSTNGTINGERPE